MAISRGLLTSLPAAVILAELAAAAAPTTELHRTYEGAAKTTSEVARLLVPPSMQVRSIDGRGLVTPLSGLLELLPGRHHLRANPTAPPRDGIRFYKSNEVTFDFAAGAEYRLDGNADDLGWAPTVVPAVRPLGPAREAADSICWLESISGTVVAVERRGIKIKRVTLQLDGEPSNRTWDYLAPALVRPDGMMKAFASGWSRDGSLWGYDVGARAALQPGQRLRASYSGCDPATLIEFQLPEGWKPPA